MEMTDAVALSVPRLAEMAAAELLSRGYRIEPAQLAAA
jgi:hypothetical protein